MTGSTSPEFSMRLGYDTLGHPQYNGNISTQKWGSGTSYPKRFDYLYDKLNRLTNGTSVGSGTNMLEDLTYDVMGNIASLDRDGAGISTYGYSGNRLTGISGGTMTTGSYAYDANGNATTDGRTGVSLGYNLLNLPVTATKTGLSLSYTYDAMGQKLRKVNNTTSTTTDYVGGIQYTNGAIDFIQTEEGKAINSGGTYVYNYNLSDHLGNTRYSFDIYLGSFPPFRGNKGVGNCRGMIITPSEKGLRLRVVPTSTCTTGRSYRRSLGSTITGLGSMIRRSGVSIE